MKAFCGDRMIPDPFSDIRLQPVTVDEDCMFVLYELLKQRAFKISHDDLPSFEEHCAFVKSNPYRYWAIIHQSQSVVGAVYVTNFNTIGIQLVKCDHYSKMYEFIVSNVAKNISPLPGEKSLISDGFCINVSPLDRLANESLTSMGCELKQLTYKLPAFWSEQS